MKNKMEKFVVSGILNIGDSFENHRHLKLFECFIVAESEEEAKKIIAKDLHIEIYQKNKDHKLMNAGDWANAVSYLDPSLFK